MIQNWGRERKDLKSNAKFGVKYEVKTFLMSVCYKLCCYIASKIYPGDFQTTS